MNDNGVNVKDLVGKYRKKLQLNHRNHRKVWPFCDHRPLLSDSRSRLFSLSKGWKILGYCDAPYPSSRRNHDDAVVLEFDGRENFDYDEAGVYWIHCKLKDMNFIGIDKILK